jgi:hypothetical protein
VWQTSQAFNTALARNRRIATRVEVLYQGKTQAVLDVAVEGSITAENSTVRRSGNVRIIDPEGTLTPVTARDLLAPRGTELRVFKGLYLPGVPDPEMVPLGTLRISEPQIRREQGGVVIDVKAFDRARAIQRARFRAPWVIPAGTVVSDAMAAIITSRSTFPVNITPTTATTPALVFENLTDPWDALNQLADSVAYEAFFDVLGTFVGRPTPQYESLTPSWDYSPGELSLLVDNSRTLTDVDAYSGVVVTAEHPDNVNPIRVEVWDTDPNSPTYYDPAHPELSEFGPVPFGFASPIINTTDQATLAGQTILARVGGLREKVTVETLGHFGHDVGDVVSASDPDTRLAGTHVIDQVVQPLRRGTMTITMRTRRAVQT